MNIVICPFQPRFLAPIVELLSRAMPRDAVSQQRFTQQVTLDPNFRADGFLVALVDGEVAGFCLTISRHVPLENAPDDRARGYITLFAVDEKRRRCGIGARLLDAAHEYLRAQGCTCALISPYAPGYFIPGVDVEAYAEALRFFARRGYDEVYRPLSMRASLKDWREPETIAAKREILHRAGVSFQTYRPELTLPVLEFVRREFPGDWVRIARAAMEEICGGASGARLTCAFAGDDLLGFAHYNGERFGPIGVAASERGRGLGQVLMAITLRAQAQNGCLSSWFQWTDDLTAARLYKGAGFREARRFAVLRRELSGS